MHIYIGALQLAAVIILSILLLCGLPLGELTMGGRYKVWPRKLRPVAASQLAVQIFALYILLAFFVTALILIGGLLISLIKLDISFAGSAFVEN